MSALAAPVLQMVTATGTDELKGFGHDAWWVILIKAVLIFVILVVLTLFNIWWERRVVARMQHRIGPNVHGPFGLLQSLADGTIWVPANSFGDGVLAGLASPGSRVTVKGANQ